MHDTNIQWTLLYMTEVYSAVSRYNMALKTLVSVHILQSAPYQSIINHGIITVTIRPSEHDTDMMISNTSVSSKQPHHILT